MCIPWPFCGPVDKSGLVLVPSGRVEPSDTQRMRMRMSMRTCVVSPSYPVRRIRLYRDLPTRTRPRTPTDTQRPRYLGHPGLPAQVCPGSSRPDRFLPGLILSLSPSRPRSPAQVLPAQFDFVSLSKFRLRLICCPVALLPFAPMVLLIFFFLVKSPRYSV